MNIQRYKDKSECVNAVNYLNYLPTVKSICTRLNLSTRDVFSLAFHLS